MYKVLVVDDEPIAVEAVVVMIKGSFPGLLSVDSCNSGKMAIEMASKLHPDIVIMDIDMPGINGLEAIKKIREHLHDAIFIILSAFDYFGFAQQAIALGVIEYLVKPVKEEDLNRVLNRVMVNIRSHSDDEQIKLEQEERLLMSIPIMERDFLHALTYMDSDRRSLGDTCRLLGFEDIGGFVVLCSYAKPGFSETPLLDINNFKLGLRASLDFVIGQLRNKEIILYVFDGREEDESRSKAYRIARQFIEYARQQKLEMICGIGGWKSTVLEAGDSYREAKEVIDLLKNHEKLNYEHIDVLDISEAANIRPDTNRSNAEELEEYLEEYLPTEDPMIIMRKYDWFIQEENKKSTPFHGIKDIIADVELNVERKLDFSSDHSRMNLDKLLSAKNIAELEEAINQVVPKNCELLISKQKNTVENSIKKAKDYILEHFAEPITLDDVANYANMSQYYFSRLFKQETGTGFADFLVRVRVENSKKLIKMEGLSVKEVTFMVGFNDPNYFSRVFKKATGLSPMEYKNKS